MLKAIRVVAVLGVLVAIPIEFLGAQTQRAFITIGTGGVTSVYYPIGGAICRLVNRSRKEHGIRCSAESTGGSVYNINTLRAGELDFGVVQSDWQYYAYEGTSKFAEQGPLKNLRSVFSVHAEPFTVVARADSGIRTFDDLQGKRVNIGNPGSGARTTMEAVMKAKGWTRDTFKFASELRSFEQSRALCDGKIDAMVITTGHPSGIVKEVTTSCDTVLVPVTGAAIDRLVDDNSYFRRTTIPGGMYRGTDGDTATFGVGATLVTTADMPEEVVYRVVRAVFDNFDQFEKLHPAFANLEPQEMIRDGLSAPLHDGAARYYKERGWM